MLEGFVRVAAATPSLRVADTEYNSEEILHSMREASEAGAGVIVFPELAVSGYTCADLFWQTALRDGAEEALSRILEGSRELPLLCFLGYPLYTGGKLYNTAAVLCRGRVLGFVPKKNLPNYGEFYELRWFTAGAEEPREIDFLDRRSGERYSVPFGMRLLFREENMPELCLAAELCEDVWVADTPSTAHAAAGAVILANCSASDELVGKQQYRRELLRATSARLLAAYIYASAGEGESTQDLVFGGQSMICGNGAVLSENPLYTAAVQYADIDLQRICHERLRRNSCPPSAADNYREIRFSLRGLRDVSLRRFVDPHPFVPGDERLRAERCEEILNIQARGLKKRLMHIHAEKVVIGISGGLDSTLALLVAARCFDLLGLPRENILSITMPAFGTTDRTYHNAVLLTDRLHASLREIPIRQAVLEHFAEIGHDPSKHDVVYENAQARERTQVLMDIANAERAIVIGTGDLSELALGWATYNGDHISMYAVNVGVPKTLVRHLVKYCADSCEDRALADTLRDILDTPVSPELLPPEEGKISQRTEDLVGPYELHDFFLYQILRWGFSPRKVCALACYAFSTANLELRGFPERQEQDDSLNYHSYDRETILKWLRVFYQRFFSQQFKRSCLPDGPKVGSVAVSPRGDLRMPSDAVSSRWLMELEML